VEASFIGGGKHSTQRKPQLESPTQRLKDMPTYIKFKQLTTTGITPYITY